MSCIEKSFFLDNCQSGDLLLYNSKNIFARIIEYFTQSKYSHVAIILKSPTNIHPSLTGTYIIESGAEQIPDVLSGKKVSGVQLIPLEYVLDCYLDNYIGSLYYRKLNCSRDIIFRKQLSELIMKNDQKGYDLSVFDWVRAKLKLDIGNCQNTKKYWCSALVAYIYTELGFLEQSTPWSLISPAQFGFGDIDELPFIDCSLEPDQKIIIIK
tara:strand:+ start:4788 stop:5420 length:633 start_codon:yes stop_codon:yes gene_type:complete